MNRCQATVVAAVLSFCLLLPVTVPAANIPYSLSVTPFAGGYIWEGNQLRQNMPIYGVSVGYNFSRHWSLELTGSVIPDSIMVTPAAPGTPSRQKWNVYGVRGDILYHFFPEQRFVPYLAVGGGEMFLDPHQGATTNETMVGYGGGMKYFLTDSIALRADVRHIFDIPNNDAATRDFYNNFSYTAGLTFQIGGVRAPAVVAQEPAPVVETPPVSAEVAKAAPTPPAAMEARPAPAPAPVKPAPQVAPESAPAPAKAIEPTPAPAPVPAKRPAQQRVKPVVTEITTSQDTIDILANEWLGYYQTFRLSSPARLVIDISDAVSGLKVKKIPVQIPGIAAVRIGTYPDHVRIVIDAAGAKLPPYRIVQTEKGLKVILEHHIQQR